MEFLSSVSEVQKKIRELEEQREAVAQRIEKVETQKKEGARFYIGTELPIDDALFSLREGQARSVQIALEFYRQTLFELDPALAPQPPAAPVPAVIPAPAVLAAVPLSEPPTVPPAMPPAQQI